MIFDIERNILDKHNEPEWKQENPDYKRDEGKINDKYLKIVMQSMGGSDNDEDALFQEKIISKLAKEVTIEK